MVLVALVGGLLRLEGHLRDMTGVLQGTMGALNVSKGTFETSPLSRRCPSGHALTSAATSANRH